MNRLNHVCTIATAVKCLLLCVVAGPAAAEDGDPQEVSFTQAKRLASGGLVEARWLSDGSRFYFTDTGAVDNRVLLVDPPTGETTPLLDLDRMQQALDKLPGLEAPGSGRMPLADLDYLEAEHAAHISVASRAIVLDLESYEARFVNDEIGEVDPALPRVVTRSFPRTWPNEVELRSPDRRYFAGTADYNLQLRTSDGATEVLTTDGVEDQPWTMRGMSWSPDSSRLFAIRADLRGVQKLPLHDWQIPLDEPDYRVWPNVAGKQPQYSGGLVTASGGKRLDVDIGDDPYYRVLGWRRDGSEVFVATISRDVKRVRVIAVAADTGETRVVLTEASPTFFDFPPNITNRAGVAFRFIGDNRHFVWTSERSGWRHLYLYRMDGTLVRQLTRGDYPVVDFGGADLETGDFIYTASSDPSRPYDIHVHRGNFKGGRTVKLSQAIGQHDVQVAPSGKFYLDRHSTTSRLPVTELRRSDGTLVKILSRSKLPDGVTFAEPEHFVAKAADGETDIYGVIFKPAGFDPKEKYPVVENIYAGAFVTYVPYRFDTSAPWYNQYLYDNGYVEVVIDGRGTPGRGKAFQDVVYMNLGRHEIADHAAALRQAAQTRPWMDMDRVGIFGNSYGGYFTMRALLQAPETYRAGVVAGLPVMNGLTVATATECYLGVYDPESPAWQYASNLRLVDNLQGDVLLVKGSVDANTPLYGTLQMAEALIRADKHFDMLIMPGANHHYRTKDQSQRAYFMKELVRFFDDRLK